ncbi:hypothetical protein L1887_54946 [Cichorium endivia]|nr:hypothetical protein L1887_54946 [Cichorium endivia]
MPKTGELESNKQLRRGLGHGAEEVQHNKVVPPKAERLARADRARTRDRRPRDEVKSARQIQKEREIKDKRPRKRTPGRLGRMQRVDPEHSRGGRGGGRAAAGEVEGAVEEAAEEVVAAGLEQTSKQADNVARIEGEN